MAGISFSGLGSGMDTSSIVSSLVAAAKTPITKLQTEKTAYNTQSKKITDIKTKLTTLQTAAKAIDTKKETLSNKVASSDEKILKATSTGGAAMGTFKVEVSATATSERTYSNTFANRDGAGIAGDGTLSIKVGSGTAIDVKIEPTDTLDGIAAKINSSGAQVSAGVFYDGKEYRLQVTGKQTGEANAIEFTETSDLKLGLNDPANEKQAASDAVVKIDGMEVKSSTNSISGAVPGVTINVVEKGTSTLTVDRDSDGLKTKLDSFISAYNDVMKTLNNEFANVAGVTKGRESLGGDGTMHTLQSTLRTLATGKNDNGDSTLQTLASIGVTSGRDGTLTLDATKFSAAVDKDYHGVSSLLAGTTDGKGLMNKVTEGLDLYTKADGSLKVKLDSITSRNKRIDTQITNMTKRIDKYEEMLTKQFGDLESTIGGMNSQMSSLQSIISSM